MNRFKKYITLTFFTNKSQQPLFYKKKLRNKIRFSREIISEINGIDILFSYDIAIGKKKNAF